MTDGSRRRTNAVTEEAIAQRRAEILRHTADVIVAAGVGGCSFAAVSEASGFSIGMLQHHFRTRDRLITACIDHRMAESQDEWRQIAEREEAPLPRLAALLDYVVAGAKDFHDAWGFWIEVTAAARLDTEVRTRLTDRLSLWRQLFEDALTAADEAGLLHTSATVAELTSMVVALGDGLAMQAINGTYGMDPERMRTLLRSFAGAALGVDLETAGAAR
ncbi:hypothetical protein GCM10028801_40560 [Nocardioides maradonensis]